MGTMAMTDGSVEWELYEEIASALGIDPRTQEIPIEDHINPDAIDSIFADKSGTAYIKFPIWDMKVILRSDGHVTIMPDRE